MEIQVSEAALRGNVLELGGRSAGPGAAPQWTYEETLKRAMDVVGGLLVLIATLPLWLLIAVAIRIESRGPVFFAQERVGHHGRPFRMLKFRSMWLDAEYRFADLLSLNEASGPVFKLRRDPRVTRVGALLRRTSLDELPQLINVLLGSMTLVGPRPPLPREVLLYRESDRVRLTVRPGLTCLWQVGGRSDVDFDRWMELDREYIAGMCFWLDLKILVRTMFVVMRGSGAY